jgi:cell division septal protein FtsQ
MEIRTHRSRDALGARVVPPPDRARRPRKKNLQKLGKGSLAARRLVKAFRVLGRVAAFLALVAALLSVFVFAYTSEKFTLRRITFYGCKEINPKQLETIIRKDFPSNILRIDLRQLKERLEKENWIRRVEIRRVLPSDLLIYIRERTPSVILEMRGELMIADREGVLLDTYESRYGKLDMPVFKGFSGDTVQGYRMHQEENAARIQRGLALLADIEAGCPAHSRSISEVDVEEADNLKVLLVDETAEIYLGEKDYRKRFCMLMNHLDQYRELKKQYQDIPLVDLRFDNQIVYRLKREDTEETREAVR